MDNHIVSSSKRTHSAMFSSSANDMNIPENVLEAKKQAKIRINYSKSCINTTANVESDDNNTLMITNTSSNATPEIVSSSSNKMNEKNSSQLVSISSSSSSSSSYKHNNIPIPRWHAPWELSSVIAGHVGWVRAIAIDPMNEYFVTGSSDRTLKIWDLAKCCAGSENSLRLTLPGHIDTVRAIAIS